LSANAFRSTYAIDESVLLAGPWDGSDHLTTNGTVTLYRADSTVVDMVQPDEPLRDAESLPVAIEPRPADRPGDFWKVLLLAVAAFAIYKLLR